MTENIDDAILALLGKVAAIDDEEEEEKVEEKDEKNEKDKKDAKDSKNNEDKNNEKIIINTKDDINHHETEVKIDEPSPAPIDNLYNDDQNDDDEIFMAKKIVKIDEDLAAEIRRNDILEQVKITSKKISNDAEDQSYSEEEQNNDIDLENIDIDWHFHTPSTK